ncbi:hypothetical protein D2N39_10850 [Gemmobacter lutimaris]|uniref:Uncharacterized protein n=1 Tax=Gemmobacter lutimaris TaxID=2306023 RepID=A0A398BTH6_9RHOB|nr:hypothetical protein [Gemmobacter lutimaris]RID91738.1 hypothetical protein D2N39_10850 [Gemmobacter lutimaris]
MTGIVVKAAYATVAEEDGQIFVGFVDARDESYALFRQPKAGGALWFEVNDEDFGAEDAIESASLGPDGLTLILRPTCAGRFGYASSVAIRLKNCEDTEPALTRLRGMGLPGV